MGIMIPIHLKGISLLIFIRLSIYYCAFIKFPSSYFLSYNSFNLYVNFVAFFIYYPVFSLL